jgi:hypothetical protein
MRPSWHSLSGTAEISPEKCLSSEESVDWLPETIYWPAYGARAYFTRADRGTLGTAQIPPPLPFFRYFSFKLSYLQAQVQIAFGVYCVTV